jgi:hypothetical protein
MEGAGTLVLAPQYHATTVSLPRLVRDDPYCTCTTVG